MNQDDNLGDNGEDDVLASLGEDDVLASLGEDDVLASLGDDDVLASLGDDDVLASLGDDDVLASLGDEAIDRYARHLVLPQIGPSGQSKLLNARVAIVGMGGIGCPVAQYLTASGVGHLTLIDNDIVSISNLSRQILFRDEDIGLSKVEAAAATLRAMAPAISLHPWQIHLSDPAAGARRQLANHDLIIDGTDSHAARLCVSSIAHDAQIPLISASVLGVEGQLAIFANNPQRRYADLFPSAPADQATCAQAGVLSAAAGMVATMAASVALQGLVAGFAPLDGKTALVGAWPPSLYWVS